MKIVLIFNQGQFFILPDPAIVRVGTKVEWELFSTESNISQIRWTIYFDHGSPFQPFLPKAFSGDTQRTGQQLPGPFPGIVHHGLLGQALAISDGDYKYGVRTEIPSNRPWGNPTVLADDDPQLIVLR